MRIDVGEKIALIRSRQVNLRSPYGSPASGRSYLRSNGKPGILIVAEGKKVDVSHFRSSQDNIKYNGYWKIFLC